MNIERIIIVTCIIILILGFHTYIYVFIKQKRTVDSHKNPANTYKLISKATERARDPWGDENAKLEELSKTVASLKEKQDLDEEN